MRDANQSGMRARLGTLKGTLSGVLSSRFEKALDISMYGAPLDPNTSAFDEPPTAVARLKTSQYPPNPQPGEITRPVCAEVCAVSPAVRTGVPLPPQTHDLCTGF